MVKTCHNCHGCSDEYDAVDLKRCAGCRKVYYCSSACQKYDWVCHIFDCKPHRQINTADYLALAVRQNLVPEHPQTYQDYGFDRAFTSEEKSKLLGLYIGTFLNLLDVIVLEHAHTGLIKFLKIPPKTIHNWRVRGVLVDEIKTAFYKLREHSRGDYFRWFLQNEHVVAQAGHPLSEETTHKHMNAAQLRSWRFTGGSKKDSPEEIRAAISRKPDAERDCHWLYFFLLSGQYPSPHVSLWVDFGFASRTSHEEEMGLSACYNRLIVKCTFKEFCDAYRTRRLLDLFDSKGFPVKRRDHFRDILHSDRKKSVWYLKQSILQEDSTKEEIVAPPSVMVDYGFINCRNDSERRQLKRVYKAFFDSHDGHPLALHEAAIQGNIHGYLSNVMQGLRDPKFERLMKNPYPLLDL